MSFKLRKREIGATAVDMTPMIDCVFQLMSFFVMTYKVVLPEGDFSIKMPQAAGRPQDLLSTDVPIQIKLTADPNGNLARILVGNQDFGTDYDRLRNHFIGLVGNESSPTLGKEAPAVEFDCSRNLRYNETIQAVTAVSGYMNQGQLVKMVEKINFKRNKPGG